MINKPLREKNKLLNECEDIHQEIIKKALKIQDILLVNTPNDKDVVNNSTEWLLEYIDIINKLDGSYNKHYSDEVIIKGINNLYNKIFKNRR